MAFSDTVQTTTNLTEGMQTFYSKLFLKWEEQVIRYGQFATPYDIPKASGKTMQLFGYRPFAIVDTADVEGVVSANIQTIDQRNVTATLKEWSAVAKISTLASMTHIDPELRGVTKLSGDQAGRTIDNQYGLELGRAGHYPIRVDEVSGAAGTRNYLEFSPTSAGSTTTIISTTVTEATDDRLNGAHIICTAGPNYPWAGRVTDFVAATDTLTVDPAMPKASSTSDTFRWVDTIGIAAADIVTSADINQALITAENNIAMPQGDGYYGAVTSPYVLGDIRTDTTWVNAQSYSGVTQLYKGEVGKWFNIRFAYTTQPYRENAMTGTGGGATNRAAGGVFNTFIFGTESFGGVRLSGENQKVWVRSWEQLGQSTPSFGTIGWKDIHTAKSTNAMWVIDIISGATNVVMT